MKQETVFKRLLDYFNTLPDAELQTLAEVLSDTKVRHTISSLIRNLLTLRASEKRVAYSKRSESSNQSSRPLPSTSGSRAFKEPTPIKIPDVKQFDSAMEIILGDRDIFPSTKDVLRCISEVFSISLKYEDYYRSGRRKAIRKLLQKTNRIPEKMKRNYLRRLMSYTAAEQPGSSQYRELFNTLLGNE